MGNGIVQELCESRGGRPGLSVLTSLLVSVDVKIRHWSYLSLICQLTSEDIKHHFIMGMAISLPWTLSNNEEHGEVWTGSSVISWLGGVAPVGCPTY